MNRSSFYPTIDDIVFNVALAYENLNRGKFSKLNGTNYHSLKRQNTIAKTGINYSKRTDTDIVLYIKLAPYIIKVMKEHYLFEGVKVGRNFCLNGNLIAFTGPPMVLRNSYYNHPFVFNSPQNKICFGGDGRGGRWGREDLDIYWNNWYDTTNTTKTGAPFKIAKWLEEGRFVIQEGYFGSHTKVHSLSRINFSSEYKTPTEALISRVEIIEPPKKQNFP